MLNSAVKKERMMAWTNTTSLENFFANQNKMLLKTCEKLRSHRNIGLPRDLCCSHLEGGVGVEERDRVERLGRLGRE